LQEEEQAVVRRLSEKKPGPAGRGTLAHIVLEKRNIHHRLVRETTIPKGGGGLRRGEYDPLEGKKISSSLAVPGRKVDYKRGSVVPSLWEDGGGGKIEKRERFAFRRETVASFRFGLPEKRTTLEGSRKDGKELSAKGT